MDKQILPVRNILVRKEIAETHFKCDLLKCKGACCTFESNYGAPVTWEEVDAINNILPKVVNYIPKAHKDLIDEQGFYEIKKDEPLLRSYQQKACVFVYYENEVAKCAIEKAYIEGK